MTTLSDVADFLRRARREVGLTQEALAQSAGVSRTTVARMETLAKGDMSAFLHCCGCWKPPAMILNSLNVAIAERLRISWPNSGGGD